MAGEMACGQHSYEVFILTTEQQNQSWAGNILTENWPEQVDCGETLSLCFKGAVDMDGVWNLHREPTCRMFSVIFFLVFAPPL